MMRQVKKYLVATQSKLYAKLSAMNLIDSFNLVQQLVTVQRRKKRILNVSVLDFE